MPATSTPRAVRFALCLAIVAVVTAVCYYGIHANATTVALMMLLVVLGVGTRWGLAEATFTSIAAVLAFNYYFLPPVHTFTISDPQNWVALLAFLVSAILASRLSEQARREAENATRRRKEVERLYSLSQQLLATENVLELNNRSEERRVGK